MAVFGFLWAGCWMMELEVLDDGVGIALDGCVRVFIGRLLDDGVGIALLDGYVWVCVDDKSFSQALNSKLSFYILLTLYICL